LKVGIQQTNPSFFSLREISAVKEIKKLDETSTYLLKYSKVAYLLPEYKNDEYPGRKVTNPNHPRL
jgi:hypothetical protein